MGGCSHLRLTEVCLVQFSSASQPPVLSSASEMVADARHPVPLLAAFLLLFLLVDGVAGGFESINNWPTPVKNDSSGEMAERFGEPVKARGLPPSNLADEEIEFAVYPAHPHSKPREQVHWQTSGVSQSPAPKPFVSMRTLAASTTFSLSPWQYITDGPAYDGEGACVGYWYRTINPPTATITVLLVLESEWPQWLAGGKVHYVGKCSFVSTTLAQLPIIQCSPLSQYGQRTPLRWVLCAESEAVTVEGLRYFTDGLCPAACGNANCQNSGLCNGAGGCDCAPNGWTGPTCSTPICSAGRCNRGQICIQPDVCGCPTGWSGADCSKPICSTQCVSGQGICTAPDTCSCNRGFSGFSCAGVDGGYSDWGSSGVCLPDGYGGCTATQTRTCTNPAPAYDGRDCNALGPSTRSVPCTCPFPSAEGSSNPSNVQSKDNFESINDWPTTLKVAFGVGVGGILVTIILTVVLGQWDWCCLPAPRARDGRQRPSCLRVETDLNNCGQGEGDGVRIIYVLLQLGSLACSIAAMALNRQSQVRQNRGPVVSKVSESLRLVYSQSLSPARVLDVFRLDWSGMVWRGAQLISIGVLGTKVELPGLIDEFTKFSDCDQGKVSCHVLLGGSIGTLVFMCVACVYLLIGLAWHFRLFDLAQPHRGVQLHLLAFNSLLLAGVLWGVVIHYPATVNLGSIEGATLELDISFWLCVGATAALLPCIVYAWKQWKWANTEQLRARVDQAHAVLDRLQGEIEAQVYMADIELAQRRSMGLDEGCEPEPDAFKIARYSVAQQPLPPPSVQEFGGAPPVHVFAASEPGAQVQLSDIALLEEDDGGRLIAALEPRSLDSPSRAQRYALEQPHSPSGQQQQQMDDSQGRRTMALASASAQLQPASQSPLVPSRASRSMLPQDAAGVRAASPRSPSSPSALLAAARLAASKRVQWQRLAEKLGLPTPADAQAFAEEQGYSQATIDELLAAEE